MENTNYKKLNPELIDELIKIVGLELIITGEDMFHYGHDETEDLNFEPEIVVRPINAQQISEILLFANKHLIPVTPRAGGTGLSGGALPVHGGIVISVEKLNKLIEIDEKNLQATVEPGMICQHFMDEVEKVGLFYPVDPSSKGSSMLGGNLAESAGGPRAVKYGTIRDYVLNIEMVLPTGEIIQTGSNTLKFASGYNLTQLMIGSEGTLGIVTKIVFKLIPKPTHNLLMLAPFTSCENACLAVSAIFRAGFLPSALEFMEKSAVEWVVEYEKINFISEKGTEAYLLIEVDGTNPDLLMLECEKISEVLMSFDVGDILFAESSAQKESLWRIRRSIALSVKANSIYKEEDTVVPRAALAKLLAGVKEIGNSFGFKSICYGHAGDGNLHINIIKSTMSDYDWENKLPVAIREIFKLTVSLGGNISGEHGIGWVQKQYLDVIYSEVHLNLLRGIKKLFDPNLILNPSKIVN